ncbi:AAA family ATPase, partial [Chloroflexota bacterium]
KTYFCGKLSERLPFAILESDALRKILFSPPGYSPRESSRLFLAVRRLIERLLKKGIPLILDATNLSEQHREYLYSVADRLDIKLVLVRVEAPPQVVRGRLESRQGDSGNKSDANWTIYQKMRSLTQKISRKHYAVDTSQDITPVLDRIVKEVRR